MTPEQILKLLKEEELHQREVDRAAGAREQLERQLQEQFAVDLPEAQKLLNKLKLEVIAQEVTLQEEVSKLKEKHQKHLEKHLENT